MLINLLLLIVGCGTFLGGYETYLRAKMNDTDQVKTVIDRPIYMQDPQLGWYHKSNLQFDYSGGKSFLNEFGHRSNFNPEADKRILLLGDSFVFGMNVGQDQTMAAFLQKRLPPGTWTVMNGGVIGYTIGQELIYLEREFEKTKPDIVVLNIFVGNDLTEQRRNNIERDKDGNPLRLRDQEVMVNASGYLASRTPIPFNSLALADLYQRWKELMIKKNAYPGYTWAAFLDKKHPNYPTDMDSLWQQYEQDLKRMENFLKEKNVEFVVVIIPMDVQVNKAYWEKYPHRVFEEKEYASQLPQKRLQELCKKNKLQCVDLLPVFKKNSKQQLYFKALDPHFDVAGNKLAAETLFQKLSDFHFL